MILWYTKSHIWCSNLHTSLTPEHVKEQSCNYYWKREELNYEDQRSDARLKECTKFARYLSQWSALTQEYEALEDSKLQLLRTLQVIAKAQKPLRQKDLESLETIVMPTKNLKILPELNIFIIICDTILFIINISILFIILKISFMKYNTTVYCRTKA